MKTKKQIKEKLEEVQYRIRMNSKPPANENDASASFRSYVVTGLEAKEEILKWILR
jgi:hypothetical protein